MTNPFQSIMGKQDDQEPQAQWEALAELRADEIRAGEPAQCDEAQAQWEALAELRADEIRAGEPAQCDEAQAQWEALAELRADEIRADEHATIAAQAPMGANGHRTNAAFDDLFKTPEPDPTSRGGVYTEDDALALLNSNYFIGSSKQETAVFRLNHDGSATFVPPEQFKLLVQNIFVETTIKTSSGNTTTKKMPAEKFWKEHPYRREREIVFKPKGTTNPNEYNLWRGFGVEPSKGWQKQRRLLRHILKIICRGNNYRDRKAKFKYLIGWLAWTVQNPDKQAAVVIVLKSRKQGTGKSTLGVVMLKIFGHGTVRSLMTATACLDGSTIGLSL